MSYIQFSGVKPVEIPDFSDFIYKNTNSLEMTKQRTHSTFLIPTNVSSSDSSHCDPNIYSQRCRKMGVRISQMKRLTAERKNLRLWCQRIKNVYYEEIFQSTAAQTVSCVWVKIILFKMKKVLEEIKKRMDEIDHQRMNIVLEIRLLRKFMSKHYPVEILRG